MQYLGVNSYPIRTAFLEGFFTNVLNPKVSMFYLAAFSQFVSISEDVINAYLLVIIHSTINFVWFSSMIFMLSRLKKSTNNAQFKKWSNSIVGIVFIGFGSKMAFMKHG
ncbi:LysE family translocator [Vibrio casei]|uniref:LysE family translocator n=1 Tax=Vibrio casei TaxID=673372 RepID=A0A368LH10_9VIBR|nr:LysE family transporter [Vibrio casei]RCS69906.1 hypothetical protein CIK83_10475 [Vibrio casei]